MKLIPLTQGQGEIMKAISSLIPYREWVKEVNRLANEKEVMCLLGDFKVFWKGGKSPEEFLQDLIASGYEGTGCPLKEKP